MVRVFNKIMVIFHDSNGKVSRKLVAAWILTFLTTMLMVTNYVAFFWMLSETPEYLQHYRPLLESSQFAIIITMIWGTYFAANVATKHLSRGMPNANGRVPSIPPTIEGEEGEA